MFRVSLRRPGAFLRPCLRGTVVGLLVAAALHWSYILALGNWREVVPGRAYRSGQLSERQLECALRRHGIRTVINLRGACPAAPWYQADAAACARAGASLEDLALSATRLPGTGVIRQLVEVLDHSEYPILIHCQQGADRTGLAAAMYLLLREGASLAEARGQLSLDFGHFPVGRTDKVDRFFDLYEEWLTDRGEDHSPGRFRAWAMNHYCPDHGRARLEWLGLRQGVGTVRAHNTSLRPWRLHAGPNAGVGLKWGVCNTEGQWVAGGRAGLFEATVAPGEHIDLRLPLYRVPPGRYELMLDLEHAQQGSFLQLGNDLTTVTLDVP